MKSRSAFSLVEIVLALGLVSFSMLAIFALVAQGHKTSRESRLESVSALLAGKVNSQLRASLAWDSTDDIGIYTDNKTLSQIAAGLSVGITNYFDQELNRTNSPTTDSQFAMVTEVGAVIPSRLIATDTNVTGAIARLPASANTVFLNIEISYPAQAPAANRSKRHFSSIITRTSRN